MSSPERREAISITSAFIDMEMAAKLPPAMP